MVWYSYNSLGFSVRDRFGPGNDRTLREDLDVGTQRVRDKQKVNYATEDHVTHPKPSCGIQQNCLARDYNSGQRQESDSQPWPCGRTDHLYDAAK